MSQFKPCPSCKGDGYKRVLFKLYSQCRRCGGSGEVLTFWAWLWLKLTEKRGG